MKKVFVAGLPFNVDWQELKRYFRTAGTGAVLHAVAATAAEVDLLRRGGYSPSYVWQVVGWDVLSAVRADYGCSGLCGRDEGQGARN